jgi:hypothetical protein
MVNYNLGKVYKIEPMSGGEEGDVYIGSTALPRLSTRMAIHRCSYKGWKEDRTGLTTVYKLFDKYGVTNCQITLLESISAETKDELFACERKWIQSQKCVNKIVAGRTQKQYYQDNRVRLLEQNHQYHEQHKEQSRQYRQDNRVHRLEQLGEWKESNKVHIAEYNIANKERRAIYLKQYDIKQVKIQCECTGTYYRNHKKRHIQSVKHQQFCTPIV